ncbi:M48 family metalloprotease [Actinokineospora diospyrosa]|uniref:Zn-dependent protease with chaperone function n=1 Tax=Actinokineospora diospyrosa TaxID=103728 RepID=A0ABT1IG49_9PSEU|nr:M48 family metalloprotease [Actinokineospora diospyrosa]MCP2271549.1 Zn-dependent protease with chaperone function [Actinokineospora diospyrosa]
MNTVPRAGLWWVYLLVFLALAINGAGAAQALFMTNDLGDTRTVLACSAAHGISMAEPLIVNPVRDGAAYDDCSRDYNVELGTTMVLGAVALPAAALLLMVLGGLAVRRRSRRGPNSFELEARFDALCVSQGLVGRRRPRLVLAARASGIRQAFTTGLPGARPWVVVPEAYAHVDPNEFEIVASHELGHVHANDVLWASAVWWTGWLPLPVLLFSVLALFEDPDAVWSFYGEHLVVSVVTAVAVLALRAALLRRRELAADRYAGEVLGDPRAVRAVLVGTTRKRPLFAVHPSVAERSTSGGQRWEGGLIVSAVAGVVAMLFYQVCHFVIRAFAGATADALVITDLPLALGCVLWAAVLIPAWTRRARASEAGWIGPLAGAVVGVVGGFEIQVPGAAPSLPVVLAEAVVEFIVLLGLVALTAAVLARAVAIRLAGATGAAARVGATLAVAFVLSSGIALVTGVLSATVLFDTTAMVRRLVVGEGAGSKWMVAGLVLIVGLALVWRRAGGIWIAVAGALSGGVAAALLWLLRFEPDQSEATDVVLAYQAWWICALAGWVVVVFVLLTHRGEPWVSALLLGLAAAVVAGLLWFVIVRLSGSGHGWSAFTASLSLPSWLLLVAVFATVPVLVLAARHSLNPSPLAWSAATLAVTSLLAILMTTDSLSTITLARSDGDYSFTTKYDPPPPPAANPNATRPLTPTDVTAAISAAAATLPAGTVEVPTPPRSAGPATIPSTCQETIQRNNAAEAATPHNADQTRTFTVPIEGIPDGVEVQIHLTSYKTDPHVLTNVDEAIHVCDRYAFPTPTFDNGVIRARMMARTPPPSPHPTRVLANLAYGTKNSIRRHAIGQTHFTTPGNNVIEISILWAYLALPPPPTVLATVDRIPNDLTTHLLASL